MDWLNYALQECSWTCKKQVLLLKWEIIWVFWFCVGAIKLHTPLLMPRNKKLYEHNEASYFMDHSGMLVMLPYDLRVSSIFSAGKAFRGFGGCYGGIWFRLKLLQQSKEVYLSMSVLVLLSSVLLLCTPYSWSPDHILKRQHLFFNKGENNVFI